MRLLIKKLNKCAGKNYLGKTSVNEDQKQRNVKKICETCRLFSYFSPPRLYSKRLLSFKRKKNQVKCQKV